MEVGFSKKEWGKNEKIEEKEKRREESNVCEEERKKIMEVKCIK